MTPREERKIEYKQVVKAVKKLLFIQFLAFILLKIIFGWTGEKKTIYFILLAVTVVWMIYTLLRTAVFILCCETGCFFSWTLAPDAPWKPENSLVDIINTSKHRYKKGAIKSLVLALKETPDFVKSRKFQWANQEFVYRRNNIILESFKKSGYNFDCARLPETISDVRDLAKRYGVAEKDMWL